MTLTRGSLQALQGKPSISYSVTKRHGDDRLRLVRGLNWTHRALLHDKGAFTI